MDPKVLGLLDPSVILPAYVRMHGTLIPDPNHLEEVMLEVQQMKPVWANLGYLFAIVTRGRRGNQFEDVEVILSPKQLREALDLRSGLEELYYVPFERMEAVLHHTR